MRGPDGLPIEFSRTFPKLENLTLTTLSDYTINFEHIKSHFTEIFPAVSSLLLKSEKMELAPSDHYIFHF